MTKLQNDVQRSRRPPGAARRAGRFQGKEGKARKLGKDEVYFLYIELLAQRSATQLSSSWGRP